jgi:hypothetical protein
MVADLYAAFKGNEKLTEALKTAEAYRWSSNERLLNPFIRQMQRMEPVDLTPAVLSEDLETIRVVVEMLSNTSGLEATRTDVIRLMNESPEARKLLLQQPEKLRALGVSVDT